VLQVCREAYPPVVCYLLWVLAEISIVALDLTMVLGKARGEGSTPKHAYQHPQTSQKQC
jgi:hypothetical protein